MFPEDVQAEIRSMLYSTFRIQVWNARFGTSLPKSDSPQTLYLSPSWNRTLQRHTSASELSALAEASSSVG